MTDMTFAKTWATKSWTGGFSTASWPRFGVAMVWQTLMTWQQRITERDRLAEMDDRMLKDMGITRVDARRESRKPFWSA